jgi:predicted regulator of Ras-like GTPase activity (Roadblock/LC7/MglB family)
MRLPAGIVEESVTNPQKDGLFQYLMTFRGLLEIITRSGHGFILNDHGKLVGAYLKQNDAIFRGKAALHHLTMESTDNPDAPETFNLRKYSETEFSRAVQISKDEGLSITDSPILPEASESRTETCGIPDLPHHLDRKTLKKVKNLNGVIAVSAFFEGFPIQCIGDADFEHVAASAEDLMRAGTKIAQDMKIGSLDQLILETDENKFIIAPCGDLFVCIFTTADAHLGLIRVVLKSIQSDLSDN